MPWPALIAAAGQIGTQVIKSNGEMEGAKNSGNLLRQSTQPGGMDLGKMLLQDSGMNNSGWIVTTSGSTANATANTSRTLTPTVKASASTSPASYSLDSGQGFDFTPLLIAGALWAAFR